MSFSFDVLNINDQVAIVIHLIALALSKPGRHFLIETEDEVNINAVWLKCK